MTNLRSGNERKIMSWRSNLQMALFKATAHRAVLHNMLRELQTFALHLHARFVAVTACIVRKMHNTYGVPLLTRIHTRASNHTLNSDAMQKTPCTTKAINTAKIKFARSVKPTLSQTWPQENPRPQCAFKMSMFKVSCNSH